MKLKFADQEVEGYALLLDGSDTTFLGSDALARLGLRKRSERLTIKTVSGTARINSVSKALPKNESESMNIESAVCVGELPIMSPTIKVRKDYILALLS